MLQWGLVLPSFPIPSPLTLSLAVLAWEELAASKEFCPTDWEQARAFDEEEVCMDSPPTGHVCIMQTQPDGFFFLAWPLQPADLSPEQVKCCRASVCGCLALTWLREPQMVSARSSWMGEMVKCPSSPWAL